MSQQTVHIFLTSDHLWPNLEHQYIVLTCVNTFQSYLHALHSEQTPYMLKSILLKEKLVHNGFLIVYQNGWS